uniref:Uncharacterized protein n=1 Tax=Anabas testudineus TaxID=64144 RepID=A0AAQ6IHE9_ANATE
MWCSLLFLLQLLGVTTTEEGHWEDCKYGHQGSESHDRKPFCSWTCLLFTLQWPAGFCQSLSKEIPCRIPENINTWTIHGLWPLHVLSCCNCWPMFHSDIQDRRVAETWSVCCVCGRVELSAEILPDLPQAARTVRDPQTPGGRWCHPVL